MSYADVNGISLYYEEHGSGQPLVLLHGGRWPGKSGGQRCSSGWPGPNDQVRASHWSGPGPGPGRPGAAPERARRDDSQSTASRTATNAPAAATAVATISRTGRCSRQVRPARGGPGVAAAGSGRVSWYRLATARPAGVASQAW